MYRIENCASSTLIEAKSWKFKLCIFLACLFQLSLELRNTTIFVHGLRVENRPAQGFTLFRAIMHSPSCFKIDVGKIFEILLSWVFKWPRTLVFMGLQCLVLVCSKHDLDKITPYLMALGTSYFLRRVHWNSGEPCRANIYFLLMVGIAEYKSILGVNPLHKNNCGNNCGLFVLPKSRNINLIHISYN